MTLVSAQHSSQRFEGCSNYWGGMNSSFFLRRSGRRNHALLSVELARGHFFTGENAALRDRSPNSPSKRQGRCSFFFGSRYDKIVFPEEKRQLFANSRIREVYSVCGKLPHPYRHISGKWLKMTQDHFLSLLRQGSDGMAWVERVDGRAKALGLPPPVPRTRRYTRNVSLSPQCVWRVQYLGWLAERRRSLPTTDGGAGDLEADNQWRSGAGGYRHNSSTILASGADGFLTFR